MAEFSRQSLQMTELMRSKPQEFSVRIFFLSISVSDSLIWILEPSIYEVFYPIYFLNHSQQPENDGNIAQLYHLRKRLDGFASVFFFLSFVINYFSCPVDELQYTVMHKSISRVQPLLGSY